MLKLNLFSILCIDTDGTGRVDFASLTQQTLLELVVDEITERYRFQEEDEQYLSLIDWYGVTLNDNGEVLGINWSQRSLEGNIRLEWLPPTLTDIDIGLNILQGSVTVQNLPRSLTEIDVNSNQLSGTFDAENLPPKTKNLFIKNNRFSGSFVLNQLPRTLICISAGENEFSGALDLSRLPNSLICLNLDRNAFNAVQGEIMCPKSLYKLDLHGNTIAQRTLQISKLNEAKHLTVDLRGSAVVSVIDENGKSVFSNKVLLGPCAPSKLEEDLWPLGMASTSYY